MVSYPGGAQNRAQFLAFISLQETDALWIDAGAESGTHGRAQIFNRPSSDTVRPTLLERVYLLAKVAEWP